MSIIINKTNKIMKNKDNICNILCIIFTIVIVGLFIRAFTNHGKLWGEEEYYINVDKNSCLSRNADPRNKCEWIYAAHFGPEQGFCNCTFNN